MTSQRFRTFTEIYDLPSNVTERRWILHFINGINLTLNGLSDHQPLFRPSLLAKLTSCHL